MFRSLLSLPLGVPLLSAALLSLMSLSACSSTQGAGYGRPGAQGPMPGAYYETTLIKTPKTDSKEYAKLKKTVPSLLKGRRVAVKRGAQKKRYSTQQLSSLPHPILRALWIASGEGYHGAEFDLKVRTPGAKTPVTVQVSKKGHLTVEMGSFIKRAAPSVEELESKWGLRSVERSSSRGWSKRARRALNVALSLISPEELKVVQKLPIKRVKRAEQANRGAVYEQQSDCSASITLYDAAVTNQSDQFIGDITDPKRIYPITTMVLLHEIGHAIHNHPSRKVQCAYLRQLKERNQLAKQANASSGAKRAKLSKQIKRSDRELGALERSVKAQMKEGPVLKAYRKVKGKWSAPTRYGRSSLKESFAESYALFYADPEALKRIHPKLYAWFKAGGHLKAMR